MSIFKFKEFNIQQELSAAKVGTDGVLLGAWVNLDQTPHKVLDIGTGTGLIALMLAQRLPLSQVTAIDIDEDACLEASLNFKNSPWPARLNVIHTSLQSFEANEKFDLIVSNPPYHTEEVYANDNQRSMARSTLYLPFKSLVEKSSALLNTHGKLAVIIPYSSEEFFMDIAEGNELYPDKICHVRGNVNAIIKRSLLSFSKIKSPVQYENLIIEHSRHQYTKEYINYTKSFYLKM